MADSMHAENQIKLEDTVKHEQDKAMYLEHKREEAEH
jgi:hypothetical protein